MKIRWLTKPGAQTEFEFQYIDKVVFAKVPHDSLVENTPGQNSADISIYSSDDRYISQNILDAIAANRSRVIYHLSGERLHQYLRYYGKFDAVFRSYYDPRIPERNVYTLPLGFKSGFLCADRIDPAAQRDLVWTFAGMSKSDRVQMLETLGALQPHLVHLTTDWESSDQLSVADLKNLYQRTLFIPCPFGNVNPDTFRIMEALEQGALPVSVLFNGVDYLKFVYGDHPFIVGADWADTRRRMASLIDDPARLAALRAATAAWYGRFKDDLASDVANLVAGRSSDLVSRQFLYQREARSDRSLKAMFSRHFGRPQTHPVVETLGYPLRAALRVVRGVAR